MLETVKQKAVRILLVLLLAGMLFGPVAAAPAFAGECPTSGSTSC